MASNTRIQQGSGFPDTRSDSLAEAYFRWLVNKVQEDGHRRNTYWDLFEILHATEFIWTIWHDENRLMDGLDLRIEFFHERNMRVINRERFGPCSILEVLVGLSRRLAWLAEGSAEGWAWQLLCNLGLHKFKDPVSRKKARQIDEILYALVWRTYDSDGIGGFFPLTKPKEDQTKVEIWYQMNAYVREIHPEY